MSSSTLVLPLATSSPLACIILDACKYSNAVNDNEPLPVIGISMARGGMALDSNGQGGSNPLLFMGETSDQLGVQLRGMDAPRALHLVSSSGCNAVQISTNGTVDIPHDLTSRNLWVYGDVQAERYNNLIGSFKDSTNPFVPPSAAALTQAYRELSNMIVSASFAAGGISNIALDTSSNLTTTFLTTAPDQEADIEVNSISTGTLRVAETGYIDATRYLNLATDWKLIAAQDVPASAYALQGAFAELSNMFRLSNATFEWRNSTTNAVLATLDPSTGVFTASGGYSNLPISSSVSVSSPSNVAASVSLAKAIKDQTLSLASATLAKAQYASNIASTVTTLQDAKVTQLHILPGGNSNAASNELATFTLSNGVLTLANARFYSVMGYDGLITSGLETSTDSNAAVSAAGVGSLYRRLDAKSTFASNLTVPLNMIVATAPTRAAQGDWSSNAASWASNTAVCLSNRTAPRAIYASNTARWTSNAIVENSNVVYPTNERSMWASNASYWSSNTAFWASNAAKTSSNTID